MIERIGTCCRKCHRVKPFAIFIHYCVDIIESIWVYEDCDNWEIWLGGRTCVFGLPRVYSLLICRCYHVILVADSNRIWGSRGEHLDEKHSILQALTKGMVLFKIKKMVLWIVDTLVSFRKNIYSWQLINWNLVYRVNVGLFVYIFILSKIITKSLFNLEWTTKSLIPLPVSLDISGEPSTLLLYWEFLFQFYLTSVLVR